MPTTTAINQTPGTASVPFGTPSTPTNQLGYPTTVSTIDPTLTSSIDSFLQGLNLTNQGGVNSSVIPNQQAANSARIPNDPALETQSSADISSALQGQLPPDVVALLDQQAAKRGVSTGSPGSANSTASLLQSLGLTSLGMMTTGQNWLTQADQRNPGAPVSAAPVVNSESLIGPGTATSTGGVSSGGGYGNGSGQPAAPIGTAAPTGSANPDPTQTAVAPYQGAPDPVYQIPDSSQISYMDQVGQGYGPVAAGVNPTTPTTGTASSIGGSDPLASLLGDDGTDTSDYNSLLSSLGIDPSLYATAIGDSSGDGGDDSGD